ncbi:MAG: YceI family protein [Bacteroidota bacterium]
MKKLLTITLLFFIICTSSNAQDIFTTNSGKITFHSKTSMQDIDATSAKMAGVLNTKTKQVYFKIQNTSFHFEEKLMEEHFNENYMESDKFPNSEFSGKIIDDIDLSKNGNYKVTIQGWLNIHGVKKEYKVAGVVSVNDGAVALQSNFKVKLADHKIDIPTLVFAKIAESIEVKLQSNYKSYKKA